MPHRIFRAWVLLGHLIEERLLLLAKDRQNDALGAFQNPGGETDPFMRGKRRTGRDDLSPGFRILGALWKERGNMTIIAHTDE